MGHMGVGSRHEEYLVPFLDEKFVQYSISTIIQNCSALDYIEIFATKKMFSFKVLPFFLQHYTYVYTYKSKNGTNF